MGRTRLYNLRRYTYYIYKYNRYLYAITTESFDLSSNTRSLFLAIGSKPSKFHSTRRTLYLWYFYFIRYYKICRTTHKNKTIHKCIGATVQVYIIHCVLGGRITIILGIFCQKYKLLSFFLYALLCNILF